MMDNEVPVDWSRSMPSGALIDRESVDGRIGGAASTVIVARSTSSSSAISIGSEVRRPAPSPLGITT